MLRLLLVFFAFLVPICGFTQNSCPQVFKSSSLSQVDLKGFKNARVWRAAKGRIVFKTREGGQDTFFDVPPEYLSLIKGQRNIFIRVRGGQVVEVHNPNLKKRNTYGRVIEEDGVKYIEFIYQGFDEKVEYNSTEPVGNYVQLNVEAKVSSSQYDAYRVNVLKSFGKNLPAKLDATRIYEDLGIEVTYPKDVLAQARKIIDNYNPRKLLEGKRRDYRDKEFITIDGPTTIDRDDAIHVEKLRNGNYKLSVAVPDLTAHIPLDSPMATHMIESSTSHYLKGKVWHLLPTELTTKVLSIDPNQERAAVVFEMEVSPYAEVVGYEVTEALIKSRAAYTYEEIQQDMKFYYNRKKAFFPEIYELYDIMNNMGNKYLSLPVSMEKDITIDNNHHPLSIADFQGNQANHLIERFMILTNVESAKWMISKKIPAIFRGQESPKGMRLQNALDVMGLLGVKVHYNKKRSLYKNFEYALKSIAKSKHVKPLASVVLQATTTAENSSRPKQHFFLNAKQYAFMTSPLRRISDFWNQHQIKIFLETGDRVAIRDPEASKQAAHTASVQNQNMRRAKQSEYRMLAVKTLRFHGKKIYSEVYDGLFIEKGIQKTLVWIDALQVNAEVIGENLPSGLVSHVKVKVVDASLITGQIYVELVEPGN